MNDLDKKLREMGGEIKTLDNGEVSLGFMSCEITDQTLSFVASNIYSETWLFYSCKFNISRLEKLDLSKVNIVAIIYSGFNDSDLISFSKVNKPPKKIKLVDTKVTKSGVDGFKEVHPDVEFITS